MVKLNQFDKVDDERVQVPAAHPACVKALAFLQPLIETYCKGDVKKADLNAVKKEALARLPKLETIMKRPASAMASGSTSAQEKSEAADGKVKKEKSEAADGQPKKQKPEVSDGNVRKKPAQKQPDVPEQSPSRASIVGEANVRGLPSDWHMPAPMAPMESQIAAFFRP
jgi:hypothetical protein